MGDGEHCADIPSSTHRCAIGTRIEFPPDEADGKHGPSSSPDIRRPFHRQEPAFLEESHLLSLGSTESCIVYDEDDVIEYINGGRTS